MGNPIESFNALTETYAGIAQEEFVKPQGSTEEVVSDGNSQYVVATQDMAQLVGEGMPAQLIGNLKLAVEGFAWAAGLLDTMITNSDEQKNRWIAMKQDGYDLRKKLFRFGKFGCKLNGHDSVHLELIEISDGSGDEDMIFDLLKLNQVYTANGTIVEGLPKFDPAWIDQALTLHNELNELRALVKNPEERVNELELLVKQAYTHYHKTVYKLREWGEFVFDGEERFAQYQANYMQNRRKK